MELFYVTRLVIGPASRTHQRIISGRPAARVISLLQSISFPLVSSGCVWNKAGHRTSAGIAYVRLQRRNPPALNRGHSTSDAAPSNRIGRGTTAEPRAASATRLQKCSHGRVASWHFRVFPSFQRPRRSEQWAGCGVFDNSAETFRKKAG
jgi:hypothetical protein